MLKAEMKSILTNCMLDVLISVYIYGSFNDVSNTSKYIVSKSVMIIV
jgi:hypothetical protein